MDPHQAQAQLDKVLASETFAQAERSGRFLRFVAERMLNGHGADIKEYLIGVEVLGRGSTFDPRSDPIVRVEAGRLRTRLDAYYSQEGVHDRILIQLPKGSYVPVFSDKPLPARPRGWNNRFVLFSAGALLGIALALAVGAYLHRAPISSSVFRLSILPPENTSFESFAISPDGRRLAFAATMGDKLMLWVRELDSAEGNPLPGTENASNPFWSPDSHSLGFIASSSKLKTIDIAGGPAREIADVVVGCGGAWNSAGVIVFCPRPVGVLYQVPATGGTPTPVTSLDSSHGEVWHTFPEFLPDGQHFLYLATSSRPVESSIRVGSLDSTPSKVLLSADTSAAYASALPGHPESLVFVYEGALMARPFDSRRLELRNERTVIVPQIRYRRWYRAKFSISSNGVLVYQAGSAEDHQLAWFDRTGKLLKSIGQLNDFFAFSLSPDEKHVAVHRDDDPATAYPMIWMMDLSHGGSVYRFTDPGIAEPNFSPVWSPDSRRILFSRGDDRSMRLMRQPVDGGAAELLLDSPGPKFPTDWIR